MCARPSPVAPPSRVRSAVTNRTRAHGNVDERSSGARRFRDLIDAFSKDLGELSESDMAMVRIAAGLTMKAEAMQAALAAGKDVDSDALIRLAGATKRSLAAISARASKPAGNDLALYLANRQAAAEQSDDESDD